MTVVTETLRVEERDRVLAITLDRPERRNAITNTMIRELHEVLSDVAHRRAVSVVTLTGAGDWFCPGADFEHFGQGRETVRAEREWFSIPVLLHEMPQVTIAGVNGGCAGAGMSWACACDLRIASSSAVFNTAFLAVAVPGDMGLPWTLPRLVGASRARDLLLRRGKFGAAEAEEWGLVASVVAPDALDDVLARTATTLATSEPAALAAVKDNLVRAERTAFADYIELETERHLRISRGSGARRAFQARGAS